MEITINNSESTNHYQNLISTDYFGLKNLFQRRIQSLRLIEYRIIAVIILMVIPAFFGYLMAFITLATLLDLYPQSYIGVYNYDATTNYQFNPLLVVIFVSIYGIFNLLLIARITLAIDLKNAKITDKIINKSILILQNLSNSTLTKPNLEELFSEIDFMKNDIDESYLNLAIIIVALSLGLILIIMWFLIKS